MLYAGTSGWSFPGWKPDFYPAKLAPAGFLAYYAGRLNTVEVNYTFRRLPGEDILWRWLQAVPKGFRFAVKAHQNITHIGRLRDAKFTAMFFASLRPLQAAGKLGPVLFQLPPSLKLDMPLLEDFLAGLPRGPRAAFEFRHASWFSERVYDALRKADAALCQAESDELQTPRVTTAGFSYLRLRKAGYAAEERAALAKRTAGLLKQGDVFIYFKHEDTAQGALYAESLLRKGAPLVGGK